MRREIGQAWASLAAAYGKTFPNQTWTMMLDAVSDLPSERVHECLRTWLASKKANRFPMPIDIREIITPEVDEDSIAMAAASRVIASVNKFGWQQGALARAYIGELGWIAVERIGGWSFLCENLGSELPLTTVQAQVRDLCRAEVKLWRSGSSDQPIALPSRAEAKVLMESLPKLPERD